MALKSNINNTMNNCTIAWHEIRLLGDHGKMYNSRNLLSIRATDYRNSTIKHKSRK